MPDLSPLLAQAQATAAYDMFIPMALMMGVLYFVFILPTRRKQAQLDALIRALKAGDKVVLTSGIYGTVVTVEADSLRLRVDDNARLRVAKSAVAGLQPQATDADKTEKK